MQLGSIQLFNLARTALSRLQVLALDVWVSYAANCALETSCLDPDTSKGLGEALNGSRDRDLVHCVVLVASSQPRGVFYAGGYSIALNASGFL